MEKGWRPIAELLPGYYAVGQCADGHEVDIYRAGHCVLDVATGDKVTVIVWRLEPGPVPGTPLNRDNPG